MDVHTVLRLGAKRLAILFAISLASVWLISEGAFLLQKEDTDRAPETIELDIPLGTAERVAAGQASPAIPDEMTFVLGDTLMVRNHDSTDHQLGPLWVPSGSSASLKLELADKFAYSCSFQPSSYLGLNVVKPTTWLTRLTALGLATPPTTAVLFVYSILIWPLKPEEKQDRPQTPIDEGTSQVTG